MAALLFGLTMWLLIYLLTKMLKNTSEILEFDTLILLDKPLIIYLRSFADDGKGEPYYVGFFNAFVALFVKKLGTYEVQLLSPFRKKFLTVAIGKPNEKLPELGAKRLYVSDEEWQEKVSVLIKKSKYVVLRPSNSNGLNWEINFVISNLLFKKLILSPNIGNIEDTKVREVRYNDFKRKFLEQTKIELPVFSNKTRYIIFDNSNNPIAIQKNILDELN